MPNSFVIVVLEDTEEERIDKYLSGQCEQFTRSYLQKLLKAGNILVNEGPVKLSYPVKPFDRISIDEPECTLAQILPEDIPLDIVYEDDDVILVNKPKGMVVHPAAGHFTGTMVNALMFHCKDNLSGINGVLRPGIVHRIDRDTTGIIIACKNDLAHRSIAEQLKEHSITRRYYAICHGNLKEDEITVDLPIGRSANDRKKMAVVPAGSGKSAVTHVKVLERFGDYTFIECRLETGRTHQIRVHMSHINHALLGDDVYGHDSFNSFCQGQALHAYVLGFQHPVTGEYLEFKAPLPEYFEKILIRLREGKRL